MEFKVVGKILDAHGIKGELKLRLDSSETEWHEHFVTVMINGLSYQIEKLRQNKTFWILKLDKIDDRNLAETFKGKDVFAPKNLFITQDSDEPYLSELMGFEVKLNDKSVGSVVGFKETQAHFLLVLESDGGYFEIPYVDHFIENIVREDQTIFMSFPEDLLSSEFKLKEF